MDFVSLLLLLGFSFDFFFCSNDITLRFMILAKVRHPVDFFNQALRYLKQ